MTVMSTVYNGSFRATGVTGEPPPYAHPGHSARQVQAAREFSADPYPDTTPQRLEPQQLRHRLIYDPQGGCWVLSGNYDASFGQGFADEEEPEDMVTLGKRLKDRR